MIRASVLAITLGVGLLAPVMPALAQAKLEPLGSVVFDIKPQRGTFEVQRRQGGYVGLRMEVSGSDVEVLDLRIVYGNGTSEDVRVRQVFKAGTASRILDLKGGNRNIQQITVTYVPRGPARIAFLGVPGGATASWEQLGCKDVGFIVDRDVIQVGRKEGRFSAIKLKARQAPIEVFDVRVVFGNGQRQDIRVRSLIKPGDETRPLEFAGDSRGIDRVELIYRSIPTFKGKAQVCVEGLPR